jgi:hypothetical protein
MKGAKTAKKSAKVNTKKVSASFQVSQISLKTSLSEK